MADVSAYYPPPTSTEPRGPMQLLLPEGALQNGQMDAQRDLVGHGLPLLSLIMALRGGDGAWPLHPLRISRPQLARLARSNFTATIPGGDVIPRPPARLTGTLSDRSRAHEPSRGWEGETTRGVPKVGAAG